MSRSVFFAWTSQMRERIGHEVVTFGHKLAESGLFDDEALAEMLDAHPRALLDICTMAAPPNPGERWTAGEAQGLSGAELVAAARRGRIWINARRAMLLHPQYRALFKSLMRDFQFAAGVMAFKATGGVLISAPNMGTFFHCDATETMLWHVRGVKKIHLFPAADPYLTEEAFEGHLLKETLSDLPYRPEMEAGAEVVTLQPGMGAAWPLHWPHHVQNQDSFNVSVAVEYSTLNSMLTNATYYTHGVLRRRYGIERDSRTVPAGLKPAYLLASKLLKLMAPKADAPKAHPRLFDVSLTAPHCVAWREQAAPPRAQAKPRAPRKRPAAQRGPQAATAQA